MSQLSGKCDLLDAIFGMGGYYNASTKEPVEFGDEDCRCYTSDLLQDFEAFKKQTNGVIYQHKRIELQSWFRDEQFNFIKEHCKGFDFTHLSEEGKSVKISDYNFTYFDKQYSFRELKKKGVWIEAPIHFNTLLDLLPYLSHIVSCGGFHHYVITDESYVDEHRNESICDFAHDDIMFNHYKKDLADLYMKVCQNYFLYKLEERKMFNYIDDGVTETDELGNYLIHTTYPIDYMHDLEYVWDDKQSHCHWTSPKMIDEHTIMIDKADYEQFLRDDIKHCRVGISYIVKPEEGFPKLVC